MLVLMLCRAGRQMNSSLQRPVSDDLEKAAPSLAPAIHRFTSDSSLSREVAFADSYASHVVTSTSFRDPPRTMNFN